VIAPDELLDQILRMPVTSLHVHGFEDCDDVFEQELRLADSASAEKVVVMRRISFIVCVEKSEDAQFATEKRSCSGYQPCIGGKQLW
jgi:hypothetical protein